VSPHSWLFVPPDFTVLYTRRPELLVDPTPAERHALVALKAWVALRALGRAALETRIRERVRLARRFADWVDADPDFELMAPPAMAVVCFRARPAGMSDADANQLNQRLVERTASTGRAYVVEACVGDRVAMRIAVGNLLTTESHLAEVWTLIHDAFDRTLVD
jgi:aromatic-L-amino-acid/L-tryptophan decarboxylase